ncbi:hypothetical protein RT97_09110 [Variovorax paradoxus]|uniref:DUF1161 domain-containing protein n=1 Tax=Variovorax paradoxus TaxID=34073 RepID=A0A0D0LXF8_VARPD|nr:DUF1161 domain-containing protein [Variovorax paradoxus]KIQ33973.1 hypothetical protein RT97_09110 [Variovorax paradoxus]
MKTWLIPFVSAAVAAMTGTAHAAESCENLRAQIEAKIGAAGVARFAVVVVDANAPAAGQVVGSCELGTRKIVYQREGAGSSPAAVAAPARAPEGDDILTECKDGTVSVGGDCRR